MRKYPNLTRNEYIIIEYNKAKIHGFHNNQRDIGQYIPVITLKGQQMSRYKNSIF